MRAHNYVASTSIVSIRAREVLTSRLFGRKSYSSNQDRISGNRTLFALAFQTG